jgi:hypothetical protein
MALCQAWKAVMPITAVRLSNKPDSRSPRNRADRRRADGSKGHGSAAIEDPSNTSAIVDDSGAEATMGPGIPD